MAPIRKANASACPAPPAFRAWRRPRGGPWAVVAHGETEQEASDRLAEVMGQDRTGSFDSLILPAGAKP